MTMDVFRNGVFANGGGATVDNVVIRVEYGRLNLVFDDARGFGKSRYEVGIRPEHFEVVAQAMMQTDPEAAMRAFGSALKGGTPAPVDQRDTWIAVPE